MHQSKSVVLISMPFAGIDIPSIQLGILESYLNQREIKVSSKHYYLKAADMYGIAHYNYLIFPPNDSYTAQLFFIKYVFPNHFDENKNEIISYFDKHISKNTVTQKHNLSFDEYEQKTDLFYQWVIKNLKWESYDIIGFSCNYGQFLPSLAIAKFIKEQDNSKHIVFGGSRTTGTLGNNILPSFPFIDSIVTGEGEEGLYQLCLADEHELKQVPHLIYRHHGSIHSTDSTSCIDLNSLPDPTYQPFFEELSRSTPEIQQYFHYYGRLPVEVSRGCWWNHCSFCNLNLQYQTYREKFPEKLIDELTTLIHSYQILEFQLIGNTLPYQQLDSFIHQLKILPYDCTFIAEARADQLQKDDYQRLKDVGIKIIQTGVESFSNNYLKKMNKGVRVIDNLAALIYSQEHQIQNHYNLIYDYPNEQDLDFIETQEIIKKIKAYLDPPNLCRLRVVYGSPIFKNIRHYNINTLNPSHFDTLLYPASILDNNISFVFDYVKNKETSEYLWENLVEGWKEEREKRHQIALKTKQDIDRFVFYYIDGNDFVKIYDKRSEHQINILILDSLERSVFLSCRSMKTKSQLKKQFPKISTHDLDAILQSFVDLDIMYRDQHRYLSLPLDYNVCMGIRRTKQQPKSIESCIIRLKVRS